MLGKTLSLLCSWRSQLSSVCWNNCPGPHSQVFQILSQLMHKLLMSHSVLLLKRRVSSFKFSFALSSFLGSLVFQPLYHRLGLSVDHFLILQLLIRLVNPTLFILVASWYLVKDWLLKIVQLLQFIGTLIHETHVRGILLDVFLESSVYY